MIMNVCEMWWLYFIMIYVSTPYYVLSSQFESILLLIILLFSSSYQFVLLLMQKHVILETSIVIRKTSYGIFLLSYHLFQFLVISLSNSNHFTSAKKCRRESCIMDFTSAKMEFASAIFKNCIFPSIQLKGVVNRLPLFQNLSDHTNRSSMG